MVLEASSEQRAALTQEPLTAEGLRDIGMELKRIDERKKGIELGGIGRRDEIPGLLTRKDELIDGKLLVARHSGTVPIGCAITVGLLEDDRGRARKNLMQIRISVQGELFETHAPTPENRVDDNWQEIRKLVGEYDYRTPRFQDNAVRYPYLSPARR